VRYLAAMTAILLVAVPAAEAHPGHGAGGGSWSLQHFGSEPLHLGAAAAMVTLAAVVLAWRWRQGRPARALSAAATEPL